ncbi:MAG: ion transporter [Bacteroidota bacterium]
MTNQRTNRWNQIRDDIHEVIFEADTPLGKFFDVTLLVFIILSVLVVMLETVGDLQARYTDFFFYTEWFFTILFTVEYILRLIAVRRPLTYATSFYGVIDLLSILPTYLSFLVAGSQSLIVIRALRLMRIFRVFKLGHFMDESRIISKALIASRAKIFVFLMFILLLVTIIGAVMYLVEGGTNPGFSSIPKSIYWAIVTLTTVGFGDITPQTELGQFFSAVVMVLGYAVIAVPTGIVSAEFIQAERAPKNTQACRYCGKEGHSDDAIHCKYCGEILNEPEDQAATAD